VEMYRSTTNYIDLKYRVCERHPGIIIHRWSEHRQRGRR